MIYPNVTLEEWIARYPGLEPQEGECSCGEIGMITIPIISSEWVGLAMPPCPKCGDDTPALICKGRNVDLQAEMNSLFREEK